MQHSPALTKQPNQEVIWLTTFYAQLNHAATQLDVKVFAESITADFLGMGRQLAAGQKSREEQESHAALMVAISFRSLADYAKNTTKQ